MLVSVITPTTGNPLLKKALQSVQDQDYDNIKHLIVIDGKEREEKAQNILSEMQLIKPTHIMSLPYPTGKNRYNGHRIYGSSCYIANGDYLIFLDEDNWFEPFHVSSLVESILQDQLDWAYALRNIVDEQGQFIAHDDCESLGKWPAYNEQYHHVDTSCYCLKKEIAVFLSPIWYRKFREPGLMSPDMALCNILVQDFPNCDTTGLYSVNYRIGATELSVKPEFFLYGNSLMAAKYPDGFPWRKASSISAVDNTFLENLNWFF